MEPPAWAEEKPSSRWIIVDILTSRILHSTNGQQSYFPNDKLLNTPATLRTHQQGENKQLMKISYQSVNSKAFQNITRTCCGRSLRRHWRCIKNIHTVRYMKKDPRYDE